MLKYFARRIFYGILVMLGVVVLVFLLFQGFADPSRLMLGQRADAATQENIAANYTSISRNGNNLFYT